MCRQGFRLPSMYTYTTPAIEKREMMGNATLEA
jgi:hypothetical protein